MFPGRRTLSTVLWTDLGTTWWIRRAEPGGSGTRQLAPHEVERDADLAAAATALETALEIARAAAATSAPALRATLRCVDAAGERSLQDGLAFEREEINRLFADGEGQEGIAAFVERRAPSFA